VKAPEPQNSSVKAPEPQNSSVKAHEPQNSSVKAPKLTKYSKQFMIQNQLYNYVSKTQIHSKPTQLSPPTTNSLHTTRSLCKCDQKEKEQKKIPH